MNSHHELSNWLVDYSQSNEAESKSSVSSRSETFLVSDSKQKYLGFTLSWLHQVSKVVVDQCHTT